MSYSDSFASSYDSFMTDASYKKRADYISSILRRHKITRGILLDLACGTGNFTVEFANRGYDVIAVDISPDMLMKAKENCRDISREVLFLCQDMTELDLYGTIDCCICCLDSLNHLEDFDDFCRALEKVSLFTRPGGIFVFDVNTVYKHKKILSGNTFVYENDNTFLTWQNSEYNEGSVNIFLDFFDKKSDGTYKRSSEQFTETAYPIKDIKKALKEAGFKVLNCYDDLTHSSPKRNSERVYFVAEKI